MNSKDLIHLYEKLIESHSSENQLFSLPQYTRLLSNESYTPSMVANIRYSEEYLSLLTNEKAFNSTFESLTYMYNREKKLKHNKKNLSSEFQEWIFEKIFTKEEKEAIEEIVTAEFGGKKEKEKGEEVESEKNIFCEMLELVFCEEEIVKKKNLTKPKNDQPKEKESIEEFNVGKILDIMF